MSLIKLKPTSPGTRFVVRVSKAHLWKGGPYEPLTESQKKTGGRNAVGRITTRHKGGGSRQKYRIIDLKRDKDGVKGTIERIEHDPNRTGHIRRGHRRVDTGSEVVLLGGECEPHRFTPALSLGNPSRRSAMMLR